jgi:dCMP deaminase
MSASLIRQDKAIQYFRLIRVMANLFSKDQSTKVGALFIMPQTYEIITLGYNGMPRGINEDNDSRWERPVKYDFTEHAERNAIFNAARTGTSLLGSICIVTLFPCCDCARGIIQSGAKMIVSLDPFTNVDQEILERWGPKWKISIEMLEEAGVQICYLKEDDVKMNNDEMMKLMEGLRNDNDAKE